MKDENLPKNGTEYDSRFIDGLLSVKLSPGWQKKILQSEVALNSTHRVTDSLREGLVLLKASKEIKVLGQEGQQLKVEFEKMLVK